MSARRQEYSRAELIDVVAAAAEKIGASKGLHAITVRRLAAAVGYAPNSIYHSVGDMDAVILRLNARTLARLHRSLKRQVKGVSSPQERVLAVAEGYMSFVRGNRHLWSILVDYVTRKERPLPDWYRAALTQPVALVEDVLTPFFPDPSDRRRSVAVLWAALHGIASLSLSGKLGLVAPDDAAELARLVVQRYLAGRREVPVNAPSSGA